MRWVKKAMRWKGLVVFFIGLVLAAGAVLVLRQINSGDASAVASESDLTEIVVASSNIPFGVEILSEMVETRPWPKNAVPPDAFNALDDVLGDGKSGGRRARRALVRGEVLLAAKLSGFGEKVTIAHLIDPKKRAMAIRVNDVSGVAGFITPGDRVDIVMTRQKNKIVRADTILQNVRIRGVDQIADEDRDKPSVVRTVTVEVGPKDAQKLALAQQAGKLSLTLRSLDSAEKARLPSIDIDDLFEGKKRIKGKAATTVIVNRAGVRLKVRVPD